MNIIETNLKWNGEFAYANNPEMIVEHHADSSICTIEDIHRWHQAKGWIGCGYHFFIRKDGSTYRGRPENACGAHCSGVNDTSIGVCVEGMYMKENMPEAQKRAVIELGVYLVNKYPGIRDVIRHSDIYPTSCCGVNYPFLDVKDAILNRRI